MIERELRENARVLSELPVRPRRALEVGALPGQFCILATREAQNIPERTAINMVSFSEPTPGVEFVQGDARSLDFPDGSFDLVVCASTLEHVPEFWLVVQEMHRVLAPSGFLVVSTPGYRQLAGESKVQQVAQRLPLPDLLRRGTITMRVHDRRDFYRFTEDAYREVILVGLSDVQIWHIMIPPRVFGLGRKL